MAQAAICMVIHTHIHQYLYVDVDIWHCGVVSTECLDTARFSILNSCKIAGRIDVVTGNLKKISEIFQYKELL